MPLITVTYSSFRKAPSLKAEIASAVSDLTARILRKDPKVTAIIVKSVDAADWFAGGKSLAEQSRPTRQFLRWISVAQGRTTRLITLDQICYFQADNKYTIVVTAAAQSLINKTITELVDELDPDMFLQIHRGTVVNVNAIASVHRGLRGRMHVRLKQRDEMLAVSGSFAHVVKQM